MRNSAKLEKTRFRATYLFTYIDGKILQEMRKIEKDRQRGGERKSKPMRGREVER